jgi:putative phosphoesterase
MAYRIGVIADTHVPEFLPALPKGVGQVFQGVDMILHAGDITGEVVLEELRAIAPVVAIKGDHDQLKLQERTVVECGGMRIGLLHGRRPRWQEAPSLFYNTLSVKDHAWGGFQQQVVRSFDKVDAIVFGHFHHPYVGTHEGVLLFNPGAIYQPSPENVRARLMMTRLPWRRLYLQRSLRRPLRLPTVGILTIDEGAIKPEIIPLP